MRRRALFLDRDGVVNIDHGYVCAPVDCQFVEGIFELCQTADRLEFLIFIVTNQAGIGRGYYTEQQFLEFSAWMAREFQRHAVPLAKIYYCPFHPEQGLGHYKQESNFRKPGPGMILQAAEEFALDLGRSILVGDKATDIEAGLRAGVGRNFLFTPGRVPESVDPSAVVVDRLQAVTEFLNITGILP